MPSMTVTYQSVNLSRSNTAVPLVQGIEREIPVKLVVTLGELNMTLKHCNICNQLNNKR